MAETKRYYWIKLKEDFFQDDAISWIEGQKEKGCSVTAITKHPEEVPP